MPAELRRGHSQWPPVPARTSALWEPRVSPVQFTAWATGLARALTQKPLLAGDKVCGRASLCSKLPREGVTGTDARPHGPQGDTARVQALETPAGLLRTGAVHPGEPLKKGPRGREPAAAAPEEGGGKAPEARLSLRGGAAAARLPTPHPGPSLLRHGLCSDHRAAPRSRSPAPPRSPKSALPSPQWKGPAIRCWSQSGWDLLRGR